MCLIVNLLLNKLNHFLRGSNYRVEYTINMTNGQRTSAIFRKKEKWYHFFDTKVGFVVGYDAIHICDTPYQEEILSLFDNSKEWNDFTFELE